MPNHDKEPFQVDGDLSKVPPVFHTQAVHMQVINRLIGLGLLDHTSGDGRMRMTQALLRGHCVAIERDKTGECEVVAVVVVLRKPKQPKGPKS